MNNVNLIRESMFEMVFYTVNQITLYGEIRNENNISLGLTPYLQLGNTKLTMSQISYNFQQE